MDNQLLYVMLVLYLGMTAFLGYLGFRHTKSAKDYMIAGGNVHPVLMALAYGATFISTSAIVGFGGVAAVYGMSLLWLTACNILVGIFIAFVFYGVKTRKLAHQLQVKTFPEFLGVRFESPFIRKFAAGVISLAMPLYAAAVMIGGARYMEEALSMSYTSAVLIFAVIVFAYVFFGGLRGVIYTDAMQAVIMIVGMIALAVLTYTSLGGITAAHTKLTALTHLVPPALAAKGHQGWAAMPALGSELWWFVTSTLILGVGIGVLAQPQLAVRFMTVASSKDIYKGLSVGALFILFIPGVAYTVGALSNVYFMEHADKLALAATAVGGAAPNIDKIIPLYITQAMPEWLKYLFLFTLLSAAMSTLSGQFHIISTSVSYDLNPSRSGSDKKTLLVARLGTLFGFAVTILLAFQLPLGVIAIATALFFGMCTSAFLPMYTAALYWPKVTPQGAVWSMVTASIVYSVVVLFMHEREAAIFGLCFKLFGVSTLAVAPWTYIDPLVITLPISSLVLVVVSVVTQPVQQVVTVK
ncbi:sodium:solute symporter family protein [Sporomusa malonica]|uniref:Solute:Na+ symporter, SSS family n=1 Tax=Sporomusa malonica TaxID=112901 RepID=A0A1W2ES37_9FIRM|nr:sodium:solute symporter family protein [Sporomusa malonica]SMD12026.1 solute:Na+ symporter, SSS family [Sporomusa malonica]